MIKSGKYSEDIASETLKNLAEMMRARASFKRKFKTIRNSYFSSLTNGLHYSRFKKIELHVPKTRGLSFYPNFLEKGEWSERASKLAIAEMYVQGVSTRRVAAITEELCGFELSSTQISQVATLLDEELKKFRERPLGQTVYLYLDADYQKVRSDGQVRDLAVLKAVGVYEQSYREVLGISCSLSGAEVHWRNFLESLMQRGLKGVQLLISDDHSGLRAALRAVMPSVPWQRCVFHLAQNAQSYAPSQPMKSEIAQAVQRHLPSTG